MFASADNILSLLVLCYVLFLLLYVFKFVLVLACASVFVGVCFMFAYILSRNVIDLIIPPVCIDLFCLILCIWERFSELSYYLCRRSREGGQISV